MNYAQHTGIPVSNSYAVTAVDGLNGKTNLMSQDGTRRAPNERNAPLVGAINFVDGATAAAASRPSTIEPHRCLPSFFIVGPPRTGTSWLHEILSGHVALPEPTKETRFFDNHFHRGLEWYVHHFPRLAPGRHVGEVAPTYFASAPARILRARFPRIQRRLNAGDGPASWQLFAVCQGFRHSLDPHWVPAVIKSEGNDSQGG